MDYAIVIRTLDLLGQTIEQLRDFARRNCGRVLAPDALEKLEILHANREKALELLSLQGIRPILGPVTYRRAV